MSTCVTWCDEKTGIHYENTPMQYTASFRGCKNDNIQLNLFDFFHKFAKNIYCGASMMRFERVPTLYVIEQKYENNVYPC